MCDIYGGKVCGVYQYIGDNYWFCVKVIGDGVVKNVQILLNKLMQVECDFYYYGSLFYLIDKMNRDEWEDDEKNQYY